MLSVTAPLYKRAYKYMLGVARRQRVARDRGILRADKEIFEMRKYFNPFSDKAGIDRRSSF
jgi:hypothetical protein